MTTRHSRTVVRRRARGAIAVFLGVLVLAGCRKTGTPSERAGDPALVRLDTEHMTLRHDLVGHDRWQSRATFVLVDAYNEGTEDLLTTLRATFVAADGAALGKSDRQSLRIPAGGVRTFALIDAARQDRPDATTAKVEVTGALVPSYPPPVQVTDGHIYRDGDRVVANAMIRNAVDRPVTVIVLAAFYDQDDRLLTRPFTTLYLPEAGNHPAQFVGPSGSVKGYVFIGDMKF